MSADDAKQPHSRAWLTISLGLLISALFAGMVVTLNLSRGDVIDFVLGAIAGGYLTSGYGRLRR